MYVLDAQKPQPAPQAGDGAADGASQACDEAGGAASAVAGASSAPSPEPPAGRHSPEVIEAVVGSSEARKARGAEAAAVREREALARFLQQEKNVEDLIGALVI